MRRLWTQHCGLPLRGVEPEGGAAQPPPEAGAPLGHQQELAPTRHPSVTLNVFFFVPKKKLRAHTKSMQQPLPVVRVPALPADAKRLLQDRLRVVRHLQHRGNEQALYRKSGGDPNVYLELCTSFLYRGDLEEEEKTDGVRYKEEDVSAMFEQVQVKVKDKRNALGRCGRCKSVNVKSVARQIRSSDEGMSVFYTCQDCGNEWMQR